MKLVEFDLDGSKRNSDQKLIVPVDKINYMKKVSDKLIILNVEGDRFSLKGYTLGEVYDKLNRFV